MPDFSTDFFLVGDQFQESCIIGDLIYFKFVYLHSLARMIGSRDCFVACRL